MLVRIGTRRSETGWRTGKWTCSRKGEAISPSGAFPTSRPPLGGNPKPRPMGVVDYWGQFSFRSNSPTFLLQWSQAIGEESRAKHRVTEYR